MNTKSKAKLDAAIEKAKARLEVKNKKFERLRVKLERKMEQEKVMKSLLLAKKMARVFADIVRLLDEIGAYEEARSALEAEN